MVIQRLCAVSVVGMDQKYKYLVVFCSAIQLERYKVCMCVCVWGGGGGGGGGGRFLLFFIIHSSVHLFFVDRLTYSSFLHLFTE